MVGWLWLRQWVVGGYDWVGCADGVGWVCGCWVYVWLIWGCWVWGCWVQWWSSNGNNSQPVLDVTMHWWKRPQLHLIYQLATETQFLSFENEWNLFSFLVTHHPFYWFLSDENRDSKLIQTSAERWDPHNLDDENKKLSDITQNSLHPNMLLVTQLSKPVQWYPESTTYLSFNGTNSWNWLNF